ncbi:ATP-binding protein [Streptomyces ficellus]|nr:LuxR family transcriptional regulator [Streptomyces ficellus]
MDDVDQTSRSPGVRGCAFAGRVDELRTLLAAAGARPAVVMVEGEAGIGKSRLVAEASAVLEGQGLRVLVGGCHPLREPLAYGPVIDALRRVGPWLPPADRLGASAGALASLLPDLAGALPPAPPPVSAGAGPGAGRFRVVSGVRTLLEAVAPVTLVVEDVHWADDATRELLLLLARDMPADTALVLTYRPEDLPGGGPVLGAAYRRPPGTAGAVIALGPLGAAELTSMARDILGGTPAPGLIRTLLERSEGLPLVIEEDLITLAGPDGPETAAAPGAGSTDTPPWAPGHSATTALGVPRSLGEVLAERTGRLGTDAAALVESASVLAVPAGEALLARIAGLDEDRGGAALLEALRGAVLRQAGPDAYGFAHVLAQEAVYAALPGPVRTRAHRRILAVLQTQDPPPLVQIAHHTRALGDRAAWLPRAQAAADHAIAVGDHGTAATLLNEILDQPHLTTEQLSHAALARAYMATMLAEHTATTAVLRRLLRLPGLPASVRAGIRTGLGALLIYLAGDLSGEEELLTALSEVGDSNQLLAARLLANLGLSETDRFTLAQHRGMVERGLALLAATKEPQPAGSEAAPLLQAAQLFHLSVTATPGLPDLLAALPREDDDPQTLKATAIALCGAAAWSVSTGHDGRAAEAAAEAAILIPDAHMPQLTPFVEACRILLDWHAGQWRDAERGMDAFHERYPVMSLGSSGLLLPTVRGITAAARGHAAQAAEAFDEVLTRGGLNLNSLGAAAGTARLHLSRGDPEAAWRSLTDPLDHLGFLDRKEAWCYAWGLVPVAVETLLALNRPAKARALTDRHAEAVNGRDAPGAAAEQCLCRGLVLRADEPDEARAAFGRASEHWRHAGRPYHAALAAEHAARCRTDDPTDTVERLDMPLATFERLGATSDAARCHHLLRALGHEPANPLGRAGYGDRLSPREEQIRDLLASGATNKAIAAALFLSPRTVENHVARVLAKLHTTRAELRRSTGP